MKRKLLSILIPTVLILSVGCSSNNLNSEVNENASKIENKVKSDKEMYRIYGSNLKKFKSLAKECNIELIDISDKQSNYNDKTTFLYGVNSNKTNEGDIWAVSYVARVNDSGDITGVYATLDMIVTKDNFKFEDSKFNKLRKMFISDEMDYAKTNADINKAIQSGEYNKISNQYNGVEEDITISEGTVYYAISIHP